MSFTLRLTLALILAVIAAVVLAPLAAASLAALGFHFPFPRIFDRVVMLAAAGAILFEARALRVGALLRRGFRRPLANLPRLTRGFLVAIVAMGILVLLAAALGAHAELRALRIWALLPGYVLSAVLIATMEEGFFRAFLLGGMEGDVGRGAAVIMSSAIYSLVHLVRSPARFYVSGFHPAAGIETLAASLRNLTHLAAVLPALLGLFLLGVVLAEAFLQTDRTVYFPMGLHAGLVVGAKLWPKMTAAGAALPAWLAGWGAPPLISGPAAWATALALLVLVKPLTKRKPGYGSS